MNTCSGRCIHCKFLFWMEIVEFSGGWFIDQKLICSERLVGWHVCLFVCLFVCLLVGYFAEVGWFSGICELKEGWCVQCVQFSFSWGWCFLWRLICSVEVCVFILRFVRCTAVAMFSEGRCVSGGWSFHLKCCDSRRLLYSVKLCRGCWAQWIWMCSMEVGIYTFHVSVSVGVYYVVWIFLVYFNVFC